MTKITWNEKGERLVNGIVPECQCVVKNRKEGESQRDWFKRWMCMYHWMQTDYYQGKLREIAEALKGI